MNCFEIFATINHVLIGVNMIIDWINLTNSSIAYPKWLVTFIIQFFRLYICLPVHISCSLHYIQSLCTHLPFMLSLWSEIGKEIKFNGAVHLVVICKCSFAMGESYNWIIMHNDWFYTNKNSWISFAKRFISLLYIYEHYQIIFLFKTDIITNLASRLVLKKMVFFLSDVFQCFPKMY